MTFAIVPAAGRSTRMGTCKLALPLAGSTVLQLVVTALQRGGADPVLVILAPHFPELVGLAEAAGASVCLLPESTADMRATIVHGLDWIEDRFHPNLDDDWLLSPADHPTLDAKAIGLLRASRAAHPERTIFVPVNGGKRGHPVLFTWRHAGAIRALPDGRGLDAYLRQHGEETVEVPVPGNGMLGDVDTIEDYERLRRG